MPPDLKEKTITALAVSAQLLTTRFNQLLSELNLTLPQYVLLSYLSTQSDAQTVTQITDALHANQPAISKTTQHLLAKNLVHSRQDSQDKRVRNIALSAAGKKAVATAQNSYQTEAQSIFLTW